MWLRPGILGWGYAGELDALIVVEVTAVIVLTAVAGGLEEAGSTVSAVLLIGIAGAVLWWKIGVLVAVLLSIHLLVKASALIRFGEYSEALVISMSVSVGLVLAAWLLVGLLPLPELGWTAGSTPSHLWWEVARISHNEVIPQAVPAFGVLYFGMSSIGEIVQDATLDRP